MYGIINKAIQDLVTEKFGIEKWQEILEKSGIKEDFFISNLNSINQKSCN